MASTGDTWRLGRRPALDGLRGVAVLMVVVAHSHVPHLESLGNIGVAIFFVLSGFLITSLLLEERADCGTVNLALFYRRRALRLLPALLALVVAVVAFGWWQDLGREWVDGRQAAGAVFYYTNALRLNGPMGALAHTWSLSMEEQFYLTWPLLLIVTVACGRRVLAGVIVALGAASMLTAWMLSAGGSHYRVLFGPDTRAFVILSGCLLAVLMHRSADRRNHPWLAAPAVVALVGLGLVQGWAELVLVPVAVSGLSALLIHTIVTGGGVSWLARAPLRWLGRRSYGIYLWHYPLAVCLQNQHVSGWGLRLLVVAGGGTVLAALSWWCIEQPCLRSRPDRVPMPRPVLA